MRAWASHVLVLGSLVPALSLTSTRVAAAQELHATERIPAIMMMVTPKGLAPAVSSSALFDAAGIELRARSDLGLRSMEQAGVDLELLRRCPSEHRFGCWLAALERAPANESMRPPAVLLVVSVQPSRSGGHVLHSSLFDLRQAFTTHRQLADQGGEDWQERAEDALYAEAAHAAPLRLDELAPELLRRYFAARFDGEFRSMIESIGRGLKLGRIHVHETPPGALLSIDDRPLGTTREAITEIADVPAGEHVVVISRPGGSWTSERISVREGLVTRLRFVPPPPPDSAMREAVLWGGAALAAVGSAFVIVSALQSGANVRTACLIEDPAQAEHCPHPGYVTFGFSPSSVPNTNLTALNPTGPITGVLGLSLLGAGATMSSGVLLFGEDDEDPWLQLGAGLLVGGLGYAIGTLVDPRQP